MDSLLTNQRRGHNFLGHNPEVDSLSTNRHPGRDPEVDPLSINQRRGHIFPPISVRIIFRTLGISNESSAIHRLWEFPMRVVSKGVNEC